MPLTLPYIMVSPGHSDCKINPPKDLTTSANSIDLRRRIQALLKKVADSDGECQSEKVPNPPDYTSEAPSQYTLKVNKKDEGTIWYVYGPPPISPDTGELENICHRATFAFAKKNNAEARKAWQHLLSHTNLTEDERKKTDLPQAPWIGIVKIESSSTVKFGEKLEPVGEWLHHVAWAIFNPNEN